MNRNLNGVVNQAAGKAENMHGLSFSTFLASLQHPKPVIYTLLRW